MKRGDQDVEARNPPKERAKLKVIERAAMVSQCVGSQDVGQRGAPAAHLPLERHRARPARTKRPVRTGTVVAMSEGRVVCKRVNPAAGRTALWLARSRRRFVSVAQRSGATARCSAPSRQRFSMKRIIEV